MTEVYLTSGYTSLVHEGDGCNHTRTSPHGAQSMAKPRSREANIGIKPNIDMQKEMIQTL